MEPTNAACIKVGNLRKHGYSDLDAWFKDRQNVYTGRRGRIWIFDGKGNKTIYHYKSSKWANPFKVTKTTSAQKAVREYFYYLIKSGLINDIEELRGKTLGCFCTAEPCHAILLADILNNGLENVQEDIEAESDEENQETEKEEQEEEKKHFH